MASSKNGKEKVSSFSVTCNLLSQYLKENKGGLGGISMASAAIGKAEPYRPPTTMSLLPGADVSGNEEGEPGNDGSRAVPMELFPQRAGFGPSAPSADATKADARELVKAQLTIFYDGKVLVFDDFPAEKAQDLIQMAGKGSSITNNQNNGLAPLPSTTACPNIVPRLISTTLPATTVSLPAVGRPLRPAQVTDLPMARNASLHRFLEKRKDRIKARAPYQVNGSPQLVTVKKEDDQSWLGLGPVVLKPSRSLEASRPCGGQGQQIRI